NLLWIGYRDELVGCQYILIPHLEELLGNLSWFAVADVFRVPLDHRRDFDRAPDQHHFRSVATFLDGYLGDPNGTEPACFNETLREIENSPNRDAGQDRVERRMAEDAILCDERDIHVRALRDLAAVIDENAVVGAVVFSFQE